MSINLIGRGRSVGLGQQELELRLPKRSTSFKETSVVFQRGTPDLTRMRRAAISALPKTQAARERLSERIGAGMSPNIQAVATGAIKNPDMASSSSSSRTNAPIKRQPSQPINLKYGTDPQKKNIREATQALMEKFPNKMPSAKSFWDARLTNPEDYKLFETLAKAKGSADDLEFLKAVSNFRNHPTAERAQDIVKIFIEEAPINDSGLTVEDGLKMQVNLESDVKRKNLILTVKTCIEGLYSDKEQVRDQALLGLPKLFDSAESYVSKIAFRDNLGPMLKQALTNEMHEQTKDLKNNPTSPKSFA